MLVLHNYFYDSPELRNTIFGGSVVDLPRSMYMYKMYNRVEVVRKFTHPKCMCVQLALYFIVHFTTYPLNMYDWADEYNYTGFVRANIEVEYA